jgi:hypothetical protein
MMRILFDQGTPVPLRSHLAGHQIETAAARGWSELTYGDLLNKAESEGFEAFVTTDQNLHYQQNLSERTIAILVLKTTSWPRIETRVAEVQVAVDSLRAGDYIEVDI